MNGGGKPLPDAVCGQMEAALGADFSAVRVHVGPQAERIGAVAFTIGNDLYFAPGRFQPDTVQGKQLLGHELAHVVQQRQGRVRNPVGTGVAVVQDRALEAEADRMGQRAATQPNQVTVASGAWTRTAPIQMMSSAKRKAEQVSNPAAATASKAARRSVHEAAASTAARRPVRAAAASTAARHPVHAAAASADPCLRAVLMNRSRDDWCGGFVRVRQWVVDNPVSGLIVQEVTRTFDVLDPKTKQEISGATLDAYVKHPQSKVYATDTKYWELWTVGKDGTVRDGGRDTFQLCSLIPLETCQNTTVGSFKIKGIAKFYSFGPKSTNQLEALAQSYWFQRNKVSTAGELYATKADPMLQLSRDAVITSDSVTYEVTVTWDSRVHDEPGDPDGYGKSKVTDTPAT